jgi:hypothetical protein
MPPPKTPLTICPGPGPTVRAPRRITGLGDKESFTGGKMEWQWAQLFIAGWFYQDFKKRFNNGSFVLVEAEYASLTLGMEDTDKLLQIMNEEFRKDYAKGGLLRPDILGFCIYPPTGAGLLVMELAEVTTWGQAMSTYKQDVVYRLQKLKEITEARGPSIRDGLGMSSYALNAYATKWRPWPVYQRIVPLPPRTENGVEYVEWICFEPTFRINMPNGLDGLLLYEIHSFPRVGSAIPHEALKRWLAEERKWRERQAGPAYSLSLTPWLDQKYLETNAFDAQTMRIFGYAVGIGLVALCGFALFELFAGVELALLGELLVTQGARLTAANAARIAAGMSGALETAGQWATALGFSVSSVAPTLNPFPAR